MKILRQLQLLNSTLRITVGFNLPSKALGLKDIIKVENRLFNESEASELGLFAPTATINVIENYAVRDKFKMSVPEKLEGIFECPNSNCISHNEPVTSALCCASAITIFSSSASTAKRALARILLLACKPHQPFLQKRVH